MEREPQDRVLAALPPAARSGLTPPPADTRLWARELAVPSRLAEVLAAHGQLYPGTPRPVVATLWWYAASVVLVGPAALGALVGVPLSGALDDLEVSLGAGGTVSSAVSGALGPDDPGPALATTLGTLSDALCDLTGLRPRPLWAVAVDSLANRLLVAGRALGRVEAAAVLACRIAASARAPVPAPRFVDVDGARFVVRMSCCALYRTPGGEFCTSCPRRPDTERAALLRRAAPGFR